MIRAAGAADLAQRTWRCVEAGCAGGPFTEQHDDLAPARALLTRRACWWAIGQFRREHASVAGIARQVRPVLCLLTGTVWVQRPGRAVVERAVAVTQDR